MLTQASNEVSPFNGKRSSDTGLEDGNNYGDYLRGTKSDLGGANERAKTPDNVNQIVINMKA